MRVRSENFLNKALVFELKDSNNGYAINSKKEIANFKLRVSYLRPWYQISHQIHKAQVQESNSNTICFEFTLDT